jgi:isoquinoline 1-oxidoreductase
MSTLQTSERAREEKRSPHGEEPRDCSDLDRREFFKILGGGVVVLLLSNGVLAQESAGRRRGGGGGRGAPRPAELSAWLHVGEDGTVTVFTGKVEVGQNIRTSLTQAVAEELPTPISSIRLVMADTDLTPFDGGTAGSRTTPDMARQLHRVAATARETLIDLAAEFFKTDRASLTVADGKVTRADTKEAITFGQLTKGQKLTKTIDDATPTVSPAQWKIAGTSVPKVDGHDFVTGKHKYTSDVKLPGMLHGKVLRPAAFEATLATLDTSKAETMQGVTIVKDGNFVGVTAPDSRTATRALEAIHAEWTTTPQISSAELFDSLKKNAGKAQNAAPGNAQSSTEGDPAAGEQQFQRTYTIAYIAHAPLEPRAAVAEWKEDKLTVWTGTQRPFGVRGDLAKAFGLSEDRVRVIVPDTGSGYGGKHSGEAAIEAARLARSVKRPVKLVWTREEEFTWAYFRPAGVIEISSGVHPDGTITAWDFHNYNSGGSAIRSPYEIPNQRTEAHSARAPLKQGSYRGLASTANVFAREMHMDELARAVKMDPLQFRLQNLKDARLRAVLEAACREFQWGKEKPGDGRGFGLACGTEKGSYVAACAEVSANAQGASVQVKRMVVAFECGAVVNPKQLENQVEGATIMGLGGALFEAIEFANGAITNPRFSKYRVPRFNDAPSIKVVLVNRKDLPSAGAGETPIVGVAPAVGNAIFDATGLRLNSLPMTPHGLKA